MENYFTNSKLEEILGLAAQAIGTALEKKAGDVLEDIKDKVKKRLREDPPELEHQSQEYASQETTQIVRQRSHTYQQSLRSTYRKKRRTKQRRN